MRSSIKKKLRKIQIFERLKNEGISRDPDFMVNGIAKPSNKEEVVPILLLLFFYCNIFDKNFFLVVRLIHSISWGRWG